MNWSTEYENENPLKPQRREPAEYCTVIVLNGYSKWGSKWWYWMLEGQELFCKIKRNDQDEITDYFPCRLTNTKIEIGRSIHAYDCAMI